MKPKLIYFDSGKELPLEEGLSIVDFGIVPLGENRKKEIDVLNQGDLDLIELSFSEVSGNPDFKIVSFPKIIKARNAGKLVLQFFPAREQSKRINIKIKVEGKYIE